MIGWCRRRASAQGVCEPVNALLLGAGREPRAREIAPCFRERVHSRPLGLLSACIHTAIVTRIASAIRWLRSLPLGPTSEVGQDRLYALVVWMLCLGAVGISGCARDLEAKATVAESAIQHEAPHLVLTPVGGTAFIDVGEPIVLLGEMRGRKPARGNVACVSVWWTVDAEAVPFMDPKKPVCMEPLPRFGHRFTFTNAGVYVVTLSLRTRSGVEIGRKEARVYVGDVR